MNSPGGGQSFRIVIFLCQESLQGASRHMYEVPSRHGYHINVF